MLVVYNLYKNLLSKICIFIYIDVNKHGNVMCLVIRMDFYNSLTWLRLFININFAQDSTVVKWLAIIKVQVRTTDKKVTHKSASELFDMPDLHPLSEAVIVNPESFQSPSIICCERNIGI